MNYLIRITKAFLCCFIMLYVTTSCQFAQPKISSVKKQKEIKVDSLFTKASELTIDSALIYYGCPNERLQFVLNDLLPEFRISLFNIYSKEQRLSNSIIIEQATWAKSDSSNITIWYEKTDTCSFPVDLFIWDKGCVF